ncbi:MAG: 6-phosphogluconolactonase [Marinilabilia sp.]
METKIFYSKEQLTRFFGDSLMELQNQKEGPLYIALAGGSTPEAIFDTLTQEYRNNLNWNRMRFFWGDERCVPPDHEESNYNMARRHLFNHLPIDPENIFRIRGELSPEEALEDYQAVLQRELPRKNNLPVFDVIMLGMGDDGHTASIFPPQISLWHSDKWCEIATHPGSGQKRITLTGRVINNAENILFLVTGEKKAAKVNEIINQRDGFEKNPAALVAPEKTMWLLDQEAAGKGNEQ